MYSLINLFEVSNEEKKKRKRESAKKRKENPKTLAKIRKSNREYMARQRANPEMSRKFKDATQKYKNSKKKDPEWIENRRIKSVEKKAKDAGLPDDLVKQAGIFAKARGRKLPYKIRSKVPVEKKKLHTEPESERQREVRLLKKMEPAAKAYDKYVTTKIKEPPKSKNVAKLSKEQMKLIKTLDKKREDKMKALRKKYKGEWDKPVPKKPHWFKGGRKPKDV